MTTKKPRKDILIDFTKKEFTQQYNISSDYFKDSIDNLMTHYNLDKASLKRDNDPSADYEIPYEIADLLSTMLKNFKSNPLYDARKNKSNITTDTLINYINQVYTSIDGLPNYTQDYIKQTDTYAFNYHLSQLLPLLLDRLSLLLTTLLLNSRVDAGNVLIDLIQQLDIWIDKYTVQNAILDQAKQNNSLILSINDVGSVSACTNPTYSIDKILANCFNTFIRTDATTLDSSIDSSLQEKLKNADSYSSEQIEHLRETYKNSFDVAYSNPHIIASKIQAFDVRNYKIQKLAEKLNSDFIEPEFLRDDLEDKLDECCNFLLNNNPEPFDFVFDNKIDLKPYAQKIISSNSPDNLFDTYSDTLHDLLLGADISKIALLTNLKDSSHSSSTIRDSLNHSLGQIFLLLLQKESSTT